MKKMKVYLKEIAKFIIVLAIGIVIATGIALLLLNLGFSDYGAGIGAGIIFAEFNHFMKLKYKPK